MGLVWQADCDGYGCGCGCAYDGGRLAMTISRCMPARPSFIDLFILTRRVQEDR
uniref:Uncharacterized protein n=1 Tax=Oryza sativa subsp. japonica TaxID=39947 RepID=Q69PH5_ORYSJ|nr:hypothetical protein [Oryza sativa Japonica Group]